MNERPLAAAFEIIYLETHSLLSRMPLKRVLSRMADHFFLVILKRNLCIFCSLWAVLRLTKPRLFSNEVIETTSERLAEVMPRFLQIFGYVSWSLPTVTLFLAFDIVVHQQEAGNQQLLVQGKVKIFLAHGVCDRRTIHLVHDL